MAGLIGCGLAFLVLAMLCAQVRPTSSHAPSLPKMDVRRFLHREQVAVAAAQQRLVDFLRSKKISIGSEPSAPTESKLSPEESFFKERLAVSTKDNPIECRVTLDTAPEGTICVAPCGCSGSQKWIQLSVLNKLRRKDPAKWTICQTCRQPYELSYISAHCDIKASLLGSILDHPATIRLAIAAFAIAVGYLVSLPALAMKFIVSQVFWQAYPSWSKLTHLPLALKFWIGKTAAEYLWAAYLKWEKDELIDRLSSLESKLIEESLPVPR